MFEEFGESFSHQPTFINIGTINNNVNYPPKLEKLTITDNGEK